MNSRNRNNFKAAHTYSAYDTAVYCLSFRDYSRKELLNKLARKGYTGSEAEYAVDRLADYGYLSDERYARSYICSCQQKKGRRRILLELSDRGIDDSQSRELLDELISDESVTIRNLLERRYADLDFSNEKQVRRVYAFFTRRGFRYEDIRKAVSDYKINNEKN